MTKKQWATIVFALEQYVQELQGEGSVVTPHIWETLELAVDEMENAK